MKKKEIFELLRPYIINIIFMFICLMVGQNLIALGMLASIMLFLVTIELPKPKKLEIKIKSEK